MSVLFTVPVLGAVCTMLCEPDAGTRAHHSHPAGWQRPAAGHQHGAPQADASNTDSTAAHHRHTSSAVTASDAPRPSAEWNGRCCDQPTLTLAAIPVVRHELQIDPAVFETVSVDADGTAIRTADLRRDRPRAPSPLRQSNPILRI